MTKACLTPRFILDQKRSFLTIAIGAALCGGRRTRLFFPDFFSSSPFRLELGMHLNFFTLFGGLLFFCIESDGENERR